MRKVMLLLVLLLAAQAAEPDAPPAPGDAALLAGWQAVAAPVLSPGEGSALEARQAALLAAIPHFEQAVSADPGRAAAPTALVYAYLSAGRYQQAKDAADAAIPRHRTDPLLYLMRARAEAALSQLQPGEGARDLGRALRSFDDAANLDRENALATLQAASVAIDAGQPAIAMQKLEEALSRPHMDCYQLPIPWDLDPDRARSISMWQHLQTWHRMDLLARGRNVANTLMRLGQRLEQADDLDGAEALYRQALAVGRMIGNSRPNSFVGVTTGSDIMQDAYLRLAQVARAKESQDAARWEGEAGVIELGRQELAAALQSYLARIEEDPPATLDALTDLEATSVARAMMGMALTPTHQVPFRERLGRARTPGRQAARSNAAAGGGRDDG